MKRLIKEYFSNLGLPETKTDPDFEHLRQQIRDIIDMLPGQIFSFFKWHELFEDGRKKGFVTSTILIDEMAEVIVADYLYLDEDDTHTPQAFKDDFEKIMHEMYLGYLIAVSVDLEHQRAQGIAAPVWDGTKTLSGLLDSASWQIAHLAYYQDFVAEFETDPSSMDQPYEEPPMMTYFEMTPAAQDRLVLLAGVFAPYLSVHNNEVLSFIRHDLFSEEILECFAESEEVLKALESFSDEQKQRVFGVAKAEIEAVRTYFQLERDSYNQKPISIRAPFSTTASNWGEAVRLEMEEAATFIAIEAICIECERVQDQPSAPMGPSL